MDKLIENNFTIKEGTFIYYLHEKQEFNQQAFWNLYDSIINIEKCKDGTAINIELIRKLNFVYKSILECFLYHLDLNDLYTINNFTEENYNLYLERLDTAIDAFYGGYELNDDIFELERPKE